MTDVRPIADIRRDLREAELEYHHAQQRMLSVHCTDPRAELVQTRFDEALERVRELRNELDRAKETT